MGHRLLLALAATNAATAFGQSAADDFADLSDAAVCATWANGMRCTGWMRRDCPLSGDYEFDCPPGCVTYKLSGPADGDYEYENLDYHDEDEYATPYTVVDCGETYTCTLDDSGVAFSTAEKDAWEKLFTLPFHYDEPDGEAYPAARSIHEFGRHVQECIARDYQSDYESECMSKGCVWNVNGEEGKCEPNLAHQLHQVFKACADALGAADMDAIAEANGFVDVDDVAGQAYPWPTDESEMCDMEHERFTCEVLDEATCASTDGCTYSDYGDHCHSENSNMFWHGSVDELFRNFKENEFSCGSYEDEYWSSGMNGYSENAANTLQTDCENDNQCYFLCKEPDEWTSNDPNWAGPCDHPELVRCKPRVSLVEQALLSSGVSQDSLLFPKLAMMDYDYYCASLDPDAACVVTKGCTRDVWSENDVVIKRCHVDGAVERANFVDACESRISNFNLDDFVRDKGPLYVDPQDQPSNAEFCAAWAQESECYVVEDEAACGAPCFWNVEDGGGWCGASEQMAAKLHFYNFWHQGHLKAARNDCRVYQTDKSKCDAAVGAGEACMWSPSSSFCEPTAVALEQALDWDDAPLAAQKYHSLYFTECQAKADAASCEAVGAGCEFVGGYCSNKAALWLAVGDDACSDTATDFTAAAQAWGTTIAEARSAVDMTNPSAQTPDQNPDDTPAPTPTPDAAPAAPVPKPPPPPYPPPRQLIFDDDDAAPAAPAATEAEKAAEKRAKANEKKRIADDMKEEAEEKMETMLSGVTGEERRKAEMLAKAAIAGVTVPKVAATLQADDCADACAKVFQNMGVHDSKGVCSCSNPPGRRRLLAGQFDVAVLLDPESVDAAAVTAAMTQLQTNGVSATKVDAEPAAELQNVQGVDADALTVFTDAAKEAVKANENAEAAETAARAAEAIAAAVPKPPPPPYPPPRQLIFDDDDAATRPAVVFAVAMTLAALATTV